MILPYLLTVLTVYQFVFRTIRLQGSTFYFFANPYLLLLPLIVFWLGAVILVGKRVDRNLLVGWLLLLLFPSAMLRDFNRQADFFFVYLRGLQFFWGPILLVPGLLGLFRLTGFIDATPNTTRRYLTVMGIIAGGLTLFELFAVDLLHVPPLTFPWVGNPDYPNSQDLSPFRPWGLPSYPQPNALLLAYIFWLAVVYRTRGVIHKVITFLGIALSGSGTGQLGFAVLAPLALRKPLVLAIIVIVPLTALVAWATATSQYTVSGGALGRFDLAYLSRLTVLFNAITQNFLHQFNAEEFLFGSAFPTAQSVTGITHDWAYLDVFYIFGIVGVVGYILLFGAVLFFALPPELNGRKKLYFAVAGLALNFHYGTLNFYVGQFLFSSLAALQLNRLYSGASEQNLSAQPATMFNSEPRPSTTIS